MKRWLVMIIAFVLMLTVNALGSAGLINGQSQSEISNKLDVLFTPAGYVFSIWGLIYFLVLIWLFVQYRRRDSKERLPQSIVILFIATCLFNILWLLMWHFELFIAAQVMMFLLLFTLIVLYMKYPKGDYHFGGRLPFSFYLGWISVATIANMSYTLKHYEITFSISEVNGTVVLLVVAFILAVATLFIRRDVVFSCVFIWAIIGIAMGNENQLLITSSYIIAGLLFILSIVSFYVRKTPDVEQLVLKK